MFRGLEESPSHQVLVERGAGDGSGFSDAQYTAGWTGPPQGPGTGSPSFRLSVCAKPSSTAGNGCITGEPCAVYSITRDTFSGSSCLM